MKFWIEIARAYYICRAWLAIALWFPLSRPFEKYAPHGRINQWLTKRCEVWIQVLWMLER